MSGDLIRNERNAVSMLRSAVSRYAENLREAMVQARRDVAARQRDAEGVVEQRRDQLKHADREVQQARAALSQCRFDCGGLEHRVVAASQRQSQCTQELAKARRGAQLIAQAQHELSSVMQGIESRVGEHSSVASSALADLGSRLTALGGGSNGSWQRISGVAVGLATLTELMNPGIDMANVVSAAGLQNPMADATYSQSVARHDGQALDYVVEHPVLEEKGEADDGTR